MIYVIGGGCQARFCLILTEILRTGPQTEDIGDILNIYAYIYASIHVHTHRCVCVCVCVVMVVVVVKNMDFGVQLPGFKTGACLFLAVWLRQVP